MSGAQTRGDMAKVMDPREVTGRHKVGTSRSHKSIFRSVRAEKQGRVARIR